MALRGVPERFLIAVWILLCLGNGAAWIYIIKEEYVENIWKRVGPLEFTHANNFLWCRISVEFISCYVLFAVGLWRRSWRWLVPCLPVEGFCILFYFFYFGKTILTQPSQTYYPEWSDSVTHGIDLFIHVTQILLPASFFILAACAIALALVAKSSNNYQQQPQQLQLTPEDSSRNFRFSNHHVSSTIPLNQI